VAIHQSTDEQSKNQQADTSNRGACGIHTRRLPSAIVAVHASLFFPLLFVLFDQGGARGKDCRKCQKKATHDRAKFPGDYARPGGDQSAKEKSHEEFVPAGATG
jgi:hypothetical protein